MTQFNKGTLIVVLATVVTSILILMTGREKENSAPPERNNIAENVEDTTTEQKISTDSESLKSVSSEDENVTVEKVIVDDPVEIAAPDGPFNSKEEVAPIQAAADNIQAAPAVDEKNKADQEVQENSVGITTASTESQHELLNHIIQPIWMDQKLGDFKSVAQGEVVFNLMPTNQDGLQGKNPGKVVTSKEDKFAATIISADYNYQQMPMYNGGYYIAPMPQYLMPSVLPTSIDSKIDN